MRIPSQASRLGLFIFTVGLASLLFLLPQASSVQSSASANIIYVAPGGNCGGVIPCYGSVQDAVDAAGSGAEIRVAAGTYTGVSSRNETTQMVYITKTVTIQGGYTITDWATPNPTANPTILDAQEQGTVIYITGNISPTIEGLYITRGYDIAGGGVHLHYSAATLRGNTIISNTAGDSGGGGVTLYFSAATLSGNTIISNTANDYAGGGVCLLGSHRTNLNGNIIQGNMALYAGGVYLGPWSNVTLDGNIIVNNTAQQGGGGVSFGRKSYAVLSGNIIAHNIAEGGTGGGVLIENLSYAILVNNAIVDNHANSTGGGVGIICSDAIMLHTTIARNTSGDGSGMSIAEYDYGCETSPGGVVLTNTILVSHTVGISVTGGNTVTVNSILWSGTPITVSQSTTAVVSLQNQYEGNPSFVSDGYHITPASAAVDVGVDAGVTTDIDDEVRPLGNAPDLGADEASRKVYLPLVLKQS
jgi:parallel beta-helix repeat protein